MAKFYLTTSIAYVNAPPHIGHAFEVVQADIAARYHKLLGKEVYFLSGTDEHGAKVARSAKEAGKEVSKFADENSAKFKNLLPKLNVSNNGFIRTSDQKRHWPGAQKLWKKLAEAGDIYKARYKGLYCVGHEAFITEKDLVYGKCADHNQEPEKIEEENYFFRLSKYSQKIKDAVQSGELKILPEGRKNEILSLLESGLEDVSFSRPSKDIPWGIPVPGDASQTMYVWCDALSNYITALGYGSKDESVFENFWPADIHVIGKDILRFHAAIWPGMLLSAGLPLPKSVLSHGFITVGGRKMSKTLGNVVDPFYVIEKYGLEATRLYFAKEISPFEDGDFTEEKIRDLYNGFLANSLGNTVSRVVNMVSRYFDGRVERVTDEEISRVPLKRHPHFLPKSEKENKGLEYMTLPYFIENFFLPEYEKAMNQFKHHTAISLIFNVLSEMDSYIQEYEPFKLIASDKEKVRTILWCLAYSLARLSWFLEPFLPDTAEKIRDILGIEKTGSIDWREFRVKPAPALFPRISE